MYTEIGKESFKNRFIPGKILLIRTDRIGDVILTLPMIDTLKSNYPDSQIDFLVNQRVFELVKDYPNINKVQSIEKDSLRDIEAICRDGDYDTAVIVRPQIVIALAVFLSGVKFRVGTGYRWYSFLFNLRHYEHRKYSVKHELEYNLGLLDELGCGRIDNVQPRLNVREETLSSVTDKLARKGVKANTPYIIIHPGSRGSAKTWSHENFGKLIDLLIKDKSFGADILLTGTKSEADILNAVMDRLEDRSNIHIINDLEIREFAALCKNAMLFISNSTGPIHMAAAVGTFCVGLYSPVRQESAVRWGPYTDRKKIFTPDAEQGRIPVNVMDKISPEEVKEFIVSYIKSENKE